jgi:polysaccharide deacetylase family protein (PEP-CTERM system associated)
MQKRIFTVDFEFETVSVNKETLIISQKSSEFEASFERMLYVLENANIFPTFFVLGYTAEKYPLMIKRIAEKYDIGTHSYNHTLVHTQTIQEFSDDLKKSIDIIEQLTGKKVNKYRAPDFSLSKPEYLEQLIENGIEIDSSLTPISHFSGQQTTNLQLPHRIQLKNGIIKEFPLTTFNFFGKNIGFTGGGYFRLFPYNIIKHITNKLPYMMSYIHLGDIDKNKKKVEGLPPFVQFRRLVGCKGGEVKLKKWLSDFDFVDVNTANEKINWDKQPIISAY